MSDTDERPLPARGDARTTPLDHLKAAGRRLGAAAGSIGGLLLSATLDIEPSSVLASGPTPYGSPVAPGAHYDTLFVLGAVVLWSFGVVMFGGAMTDFVAGLRFAVEQKTTTLPLSDH